MKNIVLSKSVIILFFVFVGLQAEAKEKALGKDQGIVVGEKRISIGLVRHPESFGVLNAQSKSSVSIKRGSSIVSESTSAQLSSCSFTIDLGSEERAIFVKRAIARYVSRAADLVAVEEGETPPILSIIKSKENRPEVLEVVIEYRPEIFTVTKQISTNPNGSDFVANLNLVITKSARNLRAQSYATPIIFTASNNFNYFTSSLA